jgi:hypothetical protein
VELARLLRRASALRSGSEPGDAVEDSGRGPLDRDTFDRRARRLLELARGGSEHAASEAQGLALLDELVRSPRARWPRADELAREALLTDVGDAGRLALARAILADGRPREALSVLVELLRRAPRPALRWRALDALALAHERAGSRRLARAAWRGAAEVEGCGAGPLAAGLWCALAEGDARGARRAARRLDRRLGRQPADGRAPARLVPEAHASRPAARGSAALLAELSSGDGASARLCRGLVVVTSRDGGRLLSRRRASAAAVRGSLA